MSIITLTTDYLKDHFVGALKGKYYLSIQASIIDISHHIDPIHRGSKLLALPIRVSLKGQFINRSGYGIE
jgi:S-adenosylmethionine hydrolase